MTTSAIILASGASSRFGDQDKLLASLHGRPVIQYVLDGLQSLGLQQIVVVISPESRLPAALEATSFDNLTWVVNQRAAEGMGTSIVAGMAQLSPCDAVFIVLGDMPFIGQTVYKSLSAIMHGPSAPDIVVPVYNGHKGHPVLFSARCFGELVLLRGDRGGASLLSSGQYRVAQYVAYTNAILQDIDTVEDLRAAEKIAFKG